jgi:hypothetical protein
MSIQGGQPSHQSGQQQFNNMQNNQYESGKPTMQGYDYEN